MRRAILAVSSAVLLAAVGGVVIHVRRTVVPPGCRDPRVVAIVRRILITRAHLPPVLRLRHIVIRAGGPLAFRFVCDASLGGLAHQALPGPRPGGVHYVTSLTGPDHRLAISVRLVPLLQWVAVP